MTEPDSRYPQQQFTCPSCGAIFDLEGEPLRYAIKNRRLRDSKGPFCTKSCAGRYANFCKARKNSSEIMEVKPKYGTRERGHKHSFNDELLCKNPKCRLNYFDFQKAPETPCAEWPSGFRTVKRRSAPSTWKADRKAERQARRKIDVSVTAHGPENQEIAREGLSAGEYS